MSYIPNVREKESDAYYEGNLTKENKQASVGYDIAVETADNFFDNLEVFAADSLVCHYLMTHHEAANEIREALKQHMEMTRNEFIVSLIEKPVK